MKTRRQTPIHSEDFVLFLVGTRINQLWAVHKWLPVFAAMPKMIIELIKNRQHGMIGIPRTFVSGRLIQL
jgi:hypothetical protein